MRGSLGFIRLLIDAWACAKSYDSSRERLAALPVGVFNDNHRRPYGSIGGLPPISRVPGVHDVFGRYNWRCMPLLRGALVSGGARPYTDTAK